MRCFGASFAPKALLLLAALAASLRGAARAQNAVPWGAHCKANRYSSTAQWTKEQLIRLNDVEYSNAEWPFLHPSVWPQPAVQGGPLRADLHGPPVDDPPILRPAVVIVHGGAWLPQFGYKENITSLAQEWAMRGYVAINIEYRRGWGKDTPCTVTKLKPMCNTCGPMIEDGKIMMYAAAQDVRNALQWVTDMATTLLIDPNYLFLSSNSAGAFASLAAAYMEQADWNAFAPGAEALLGPMPPLVAGYRGMSNWCGGLVVSPHDLFAAHPERIRPLISFHDRDDCVSPYKHARMLDITGNLNPIGASLLCGVCTAFPYSWGSYELHNAIREKWTGTAPAPSSRNLNIGSDAFVHCGGWKPPVIAPRSACFFKRAVLCHIDVDANGDPLTVENTQKQNKDSCDALEGPAEIPDGVTMATTATAGPATSTAAGGGGAATTKDGNMNVVDPNLQGSSSGTGGGGGGDSGGSNFVVGVVVGGVVVALCLAAAAATLLMMRRSKAARSARIAYGNSNSRDASRRSRSTSREGSRGSASARRSMHLPRESNYAVSTNPVGVGGSAGGGGPGMIGVPHQNRSRSGSQRLTANTYMFGASTMSSGGGYGGGGGGGGGGGAGWN